MNIQRKYSLPNCTLLLEGLSDAGKTAHYQEMRPELSILVNAECYVSGYSEPLVGGREFFESLVRSVSGYAQEFLSNVSHPQGHNQDSELVQIQKIGPNRHRLIVHSEITVGGFNYRPNYDKPPIQIDLNTVQLFDLVEAVDQFFADSQTLPELSLELQPVAKSHSSANQVFIQQVLPAAIGISGLAVAATMAFSLIPAPELRPPEPRIEEETSSTAPSRISATPPKTTTPPNLETATANSASVNTPTVETPAKITDLEALLTRSTEITDSTQLRVLNSQVYEKINSAWNSRSELTEDLVYRVGVTADTEIIGYKAVNGEANQGIELTPLPNLLYNPVNRSSTANERIAQFRVVFTQQGILQVSPWWGYQ
ncbi:DUF4335 domain-containing protein [Umezakia ovalisporum]|uniref:DUF4335 domain-containing protein n=1 Tax=Umezakia ovalisporum TaxID=75695 RepID=UPI0028CBB81F|nr:DUF4335 domain-containing protein [Umezakia ovalisporum]